jgi:hypothetical protein
MSLSETVIEGTIQPDGTLVLDEKPNLPAGRVTVVLRQETELVVPKDDPFWQRMQAMWDAQKARGHVPRGVEEIDAQQREMREGWAKRQEAIEQLQEESRRLRQAEQEPQS